MKGVWRCFKVKYEEVKELYQSVDLSEINKRISEGWVLMGKPLQSKIRTADIEQMQPMYIVARF